MSDEWRALQKSLVSQITDRVKSHLNQAQHQQLLAFVEERAERFARLAISYPLASEADKPGIAESLKEVQQTMENDITAALTLVAGQGSILNLIKDIASTAFGVLVQALPLLIH